MTEDHPLQSELVELVLRPMLMPDEDPITYDNLRDALKTDLAPATPYETVLAENLIVLEWEAIRHRRMRDSLIKAAFCELVMSAYGKTENVFFVEKSRLLKDKARELVSKEESVRFAAEQELEEHGIDRSELVAKAYDRSSKGIDLHENKLAEIEVRRRRLREDYDRIKDARRRRIEAAEVVS